MIKKVKHTVYLVFLALAAVSCSKWLDVQPKTRIKSDDLLADAAGYRDALMGCYTLMTNQSVYGRELSFGFVDAAALQYDTWNNTVYADVAAWNYTAASVRTQIDNIWSGLYNIIANVNNILDHIDDSQDVLSEQDYVLIKGEALAMRAFLHFDLLRLFASTDLSRDAIPYLTTLESKRSTPVTGEEAVTLLLKDLQNASSLLVADPITQGNKYQHSGDAFLNNRHQRFNYYAAQALIARVYLWQGDKVNALLHANEVLEAADQIFPWVESANISTVTERDRDLIFSTEQVMALQVMQLPMISNTWFHAATPGNQLMRGSYYYEEMFERGTIGANDYRLIFTSRLMDWNYVIYKYYHTENFRPTYAQMIPLIRRSEMHYIAAECHAGIDNQRAADHLNVVRGHRGIGSPLPGNMSDEEVHAEILKEYRKEFQGEGQLFYYCKRTGQDVFPTGWNTVSEAVYVLPKPDNELEFGGY